MAVTIFPAPSAGNPTYAFTFTGPKLFQPNVPAGIYEVKTNLPAGGLISSVTSGQDIFSGTPVARATGNGAASGLVNLTGSNSLMVQDTTPSSFDNARFSTVQIFPSSAVQRIRFVNNMFIAMGDNGFLATSATGITWTVRQIFTTGQSLRDVTFGNGTYVVVANGNVVATSTDLTTWVTYTNPFGNTSQNGIAVTFGNSVFVAMTDHMALNGHPTFWTSSNGATWTNRLDTTGFEPKDILFHQGVFYAVGMGSGNANYLRTSTDGITWTSRGVTTDGAGLTSLAAGNGIIFAYGDVRGQTSTDGITWNQAFLSIWDQTWVGFAFNAGEFVVGTRDGNVRTSSDNGANWVSRNVPVTWPEFFSSAAAGNGVVILSTNYGFSRRTINNYQGINVGGNQIRASVFSGSQFVLAGASGSMVTSTNGNIWTTRTSGFGTTQINSLTFGNGLFVAVGNAGTLTTSTNAITWTARTSQFGANAINTVTFANNLFVAGGANGGVATSANGTDWTARTFGTTSIIYAMAGNQRAYLAGGQNGAFRHSTDGITWTSRTTTFGTSDIYSMTFGNGLFIMGGQNGALATSPDGVSWTARSSGFPSGAHIWGLTSANGIFVASGTSAISTSTDGITWVYDERPRVAIGGGILLTSAAGAGKYVTAGDSGIAAIAEINPDFGGARSVVLEFKGAAVAG